MSVHEIVIKANHYLIQGGELSEGQKANIVRRLLAAQSDAQAVQRFKKGVNAPEYLVSMNQSTDNRVMYPLFFVPPYNDGKKLQTVIPMTPKTHILSANAYELEIIRLLHLFAPSNPLVQNMVRETLARLKTTCFGYRDCHHGECFHSALIVLRFLGTVSDDVQWMKKLIRVFNTYNGETTRHSGTIWYYWLCLSELPFAVAEPELERNKEEWLARLQKSAVMNRESDKIHHPVLFCVLRNGLSRLAEFACLKNRQPYISEKDGRLYFDVLA